MADRRERAATTDASSTIQALKSDSDALMSSHEYADLQEGTRHRSGRRGYKPQCSGLC